MAFKVFFVLSALVAAAVASPTVSGDYGSVGVQAENTVRGALNTLSSYSKAVNTANSQSFVSRTDYTNNPGAVVAPVAAAYHAPIAAYHAPVAAAYHAPIAAYHAPIAAYHAPIAPVAAAYHAPVAAAYYH